ncbi:hypothetical protein E1B28_012487 [Marasmius oreades]|uniref:Uncharacterized protein n=1 Tax=Marasmius oreades TaxID=181124 RepID=A0A9P7RRR7_9AGAR|nr:uncharacterized protein E1B28_012487 [Marasmius oreades]KAG7088500.1 hypothetical protein E1B28_012487 [Marasmius oreades]
MSSWSFNLRDKVCRTGSDGDSSSASSDSFTSSPSRDPSSETELFNDLDFSMREEPDCVPKYKPNPFNIARINAATRAAASASHIPEPVVLESRQTDDRTRGNQNIVPSQSKLATKEIFKPKRDLNDSTVADALVKQRQKKITGNSSEQTDGKVQAKNSFTHSAIKTSAVPVSSTVLPLETVPTEDITTSHLRVPPIFTTPEPRRFNRFQPPIKRFLPVPRTTPQPQHILYSSPLRIPEQSAQVSTPQKINAAQVSCSPLSASPVCVPAAAVQSTSTNLTHNAPDATKTSIHSAPPASRSRFQVRKPATSSHDHAQPSFVTDSSPLRSPVITMLKLTTTPESNAVRVTPASRKRISMEEDEEHYGGRSSVSSSSPVRSSPPRKKWRMVTATLEEDAEWSTLNVGKKSKKRDTSDRTTGKFSLGWLSRR